MQLPPHRVNPAGQAHAPLEQICPPPQAWPQAPQFFLSLLTSAHTLPHAVPISVQLQPPVQHTHAWGQGSTAQTLAVPPPPHVAGEVHDPQLSVLPQPSDTLPQFLPSERDAKTETRLNNGLLVRFRSRGLRVAQSNPEAGGYHPSADLR